MTHSLQKFLQFPHMLKFLAGIFIGKIFLGLENMGKSQENGLLYHRTEQLIFQKFLTG